MAGRGWQKERMGPDYTRLRELLADESFPHLYVHKFIGLKTADFQARAEQMLLAFPRARLVGQRESGGQGKYLAYTCELHAESVDEIIALLEATAGLSDLKMIL